jgi:hypothetical protein
MSLNNLIITFDDLLSLPDQENIQSFTRAMDFHANPSFVFHRAKEENVIDPEVRKSKTCFSKDVELLSFINDVVLPEMNKNVDGLYTFRLARDYVTFIRYDKGDFFDWHTDFEKVRVNHGENGFKEMHFLYCVQGCESGGELLIKRSSDIITAKEARTTNSAIVFDKLLEHKGSEVTEGTKIIMTVDLYVVSQARITAGLSQQLETEFSDFLAGKKAWVSLRGEPAVFQKVWATLSPKEFIPFLELKATINSDSYHIFSTAAGITYVQIIRQNNSNDEIEYLNGQWYYTELPQEKLNEGGGGKKHKLNPKYKDPKASEKYEYTDWSSDDTHQRVIDKQNVRDCLRCAIKEDWADPSSFLASVMRSLSMSAEDGSIENWPKADFMEIDNTIPKLKDLPPYFFTKEFQDWGWKTTEVGYTYHCNEPSYDEFDVTYRYGIIRFDETNSGTSAFKDAADVKESSSESSSNSNSNSNSETSE